MIIPIAYLSDKPNKNNRIYRQDSFNLFPDRIPVHIGIIEHDTPSVPVAEASEFKFEGNILLANIKFYDDVSSLSFLIDSAFVINGHGDIGTDNVIKDYDIDYIAIIPKNESAFIEL
jgi:hypothetical protein